VCGVCVCVCGVCGVCVCVVCIYIFIYNINTLIRPIVPYGEEAWTLKKEEEPSSNFGKENI